MAANVEAKILARKNIAVESLLKGFPELCKNGRVRRDLAKMGGIVYRCVLKGGDPNVIVMGLLPREVKVDEASFIFVMAQGRFEHGNFLVMMEAMKPACEGPFVKAMGEEEIPKGYELIQIVMLCKDRAECKREQAKSKECIFLTREEWLRIRVPLIADMISKLAAIIEGKVPEGVKKMK